jgi:hypothetical protein
MKRMPIFVFALALFGSVAPVFALTGEVVATSGKVEIQDQDGGWKTLKKGDAISEGTMISTGFKSEATVKLGGSVLTIRPLTRMTLTQLVEKEDTVTTELYLEVGNVKAEVNSFNNKKNGFKVKSPVATASVRGTVFEMGEELVILRGAVEFSTPVGQTRTGTEGQKLELIGDSSVASPVAALQTKMETIAISSTPSTEVSSPIVITATAAAPVPPAAPTAASAPAVPPELKSDTTVVLTIN